MILLIVELIAIFLFQVILRNTSFPPSVESIYFYGANDFEIRENALSNLPHLARMEIRLVSSLKIFSRGIAIHPKAPLGFFGITSVSYLKFEEDAFSGLWNANTDISIIFADKLRFSKNTFNYHSKSPMRTPRLLIHHSSIKDIPSSTFNGPLEYVQMKMVNVKLCRKNVFGSKIKAIYLDRVEISEIRENCICGSGVLSLLHIYNSKVGIIRHRGISGDVPSFTLGNSSIKILQPNAISVQAKTFNMLMTKFTIFMSRSMNIVAKTVYFRKVFIEKLKSLGFYSIDANVVKIMNLTVANMHSQSLEFNPKTNVDVIHLSAPRDLGNVMRVVRSGAIEEIAVETSSESTTENVHQNDVHTGMSVDTALQVGFAIVIFIFVSTFVYAKVKCRIVIKK